MSHHDDNELDAVLLRKLLKGEIKGNDANDVLNRVFDKCVDWTLDDTIFQLTKVYNFLPAEVDQLIEKFALTTPLESNPLPGFEDTQERVRNYLLLIFRARRPLVEAKKRISIVTPVAADYKTNEAYLKALDQRANLLIGISQLDSQIDAHLNHTHQNTHAP
tara:strand:+ start:216 stop:701 length:486 start_codon:yes stop_codon:yes gene_type:complete